VRVRLFLIFYLYSITMFLDTYLCVRNNTSVLETHKLYLCMLSYVIDVGNLWFIKNFTTFNVKV